MKVELTLLTEEELSKMSKEEMIGKIMMFGLETKKMVDQVSEGEITIKEFLTEYGNLLRMINYATQRLK